MSVALMTRIQLIEAPYLNEFISWYMQLGFNRIYFLNTEPQNEQKIKEFIEPKLLEKVTFVDHHCPTNKFGYLRKMFTDIVIEDFVMHADSDEYLMLPKKYSTVSDLVKEHDYDIYTFRWLNVPVDTLYQHSMTEYLQSANATCRYCGGPKMMVKRKTWLDDPRADCTPHAFKCKGVKHHFKGSSGSGDVPFYIHFLVRGYLHTIIKIFEQRLPTERGQTPLHIKKEFITSSIEQRTYPFRVLCASGEYALCSKDIITKNLQEWYIPQYTPHDVTTQTIELYNSILLKHGIKIEDNILENDVFNLESKFNDCTEVVKKKYARRFTGKKPSDIGKYLQKVL